MRLEELRQVFAGRIREYGDRRWLDTHVGGLRAFIICRATKDGGVTFDLAVFTPHTRELDPFFARDEGQAWLLDGELVLPRLGAGFLFAGCRRGILFASNHTDPSLENIVSTLWDLAAWARKPWHPPEGSSESEDYWARDRTRVRRERWIRAGLVILVVALVLWLRAETEPSLLSALSVLVIYRAEDVEGVAC